MKTSWILSLGIALPAAAWAAPRDPGPTDASDGVYGRFDGDFALSAGPEMIVDPASGAVRLGASARASFYQTATLSIAYEQRIPDATGIERALGLRAHLSPIFLLRFQRDLEQGPALLDLFVDSFEVFGGPVFLEPANAEFGARVGADVGVGFGVPLSRHGTGLWIHPSVLVRFADETPSALLGLALRYQFFVESPLVRE